MDRAQQSFGGAAPVLGITGGVASGKSTIAGWFGELGAAVVDADAIARELLAPGSALSRAVLAHFGQSFARSDRADAVDRARLADRIFADPAARVELGAIMHPAIHGELTRQIAAARLDPDTALVAAEIPLLFENRLERLVDRVLLVSCTEDEQVRRLMARRAELSAAAASEQVRSQIPIAQKAPLSDIVVDTMEPEEVLRGRVAAIYASLSRHTDGFGNEEKRTRG